MVGIQCKMHILNSTYEFYSVAVLEEVLDTNAGPRKVSTELIEEGKYVNELCFAVLSVSDTVIRKRD